MADIPLDQWLKQRGPTPPAEVASELMRRSAGVRRAAEADAWAYWGQFKNRTDPGAMYWESVIQHLIDRTEEPRVVDVSYDRSRW